MKLTRSSWAAVLVLCVLCSFPSGLHSTCPPSIVVTNGTQAFQHIAAGDPVIGGDATFLMRANHHIEGYAEHDVLPAGLEVRMLCPVVTATDNGRGLSFVYNLGEGLDQIALHACQASYGLCTISRCPETGPDYFSFAHFAFDNPCDCASVGTYQWVYEAVNLNNVNIDENPLFMGAFLDGDQFFLRAKPYSQCGNPCGFGCQFQLIDDDVAEIANCDPNGGVPNGMGGCLCNQAISGGGIEYTGPMCEYDDFHTCFDQGYAQYSGNCTCHDGYFGNQCEFCNCTCIDEVCPGECDTCEYQLSSCGCTSDQNCDSSELCAEGYQLVSLDTAQCLDAISPRRHVGCQKQCNRTVASCATCPPDTYRDTVPGDPGIYTCLACPNCTNGGNCTGLGECACPAGAVGPLCQYTRNTTCNGHGEPDGNGLCTCDFGYESPPNLRDCSTCAPHYYDYPVCRRCAPASTCNGNGACNSTTGFCICNQGYTPPSCDVCLPDHIEPSCTFCTRNDSCNGRGECPNSIISGGKIYCACDTGWGLSDPGGPFGNNCSECLQGYYGPDCSPCETDQGSPCGPRGRCDDGLTGNGTCECDPGWFGNVCQYERPNILEVSPTFSTTSQRRVIFLVGLGFGAEQNNGSYVYLSDRSDSPASRVNCSVLVWLDNYVECRLDVANPGVHRVMLVREGVASNHSLGPQFIMLPPSISTEPSLNRSGQAFNVTGFSLGRSTRFAVADGMGQWLLDLPVLGRSPDHEWVTLDMPAGRGSHFQLHVYGAPDTHEANTVLDTLPLSYEVQEIVSVVNNVTGGDFIDTQGGTLLIDLGPQAPGSPTNVSGVTVCLNPTCSLGSECDIVSFAQEQIVCNMGEGGGIRTLYLTVPATLDGYSGPLDGVQDAVATFAPVAYRPPVIHRVFGCNITNGNATDGCPSSSSKVITIEGLNFGPSSLISELEVSVGVTQCLSASMPVEHTQIICLLLGQRGVGVPVTVSRSTVLGTQSDTKKLLSFVGPRITPNTLVFVHGGLTANGSEHQIISNSTNGGDLVEFYGNFDTTETVSVFYGRTITNEDVRLHGSKYTCDVVLHTHNKIRCRTQPGVGRNLRFQVEWEEYDVSTDSFSLLISNIVGQETDVFSDTFSYAPPIISNGTICLPQLQNCPLGSPQYSVQAVLSQGEQIFFSGENFGDLQAGEILADRVRVFYGPPSNRLQNEAEVTSQGFSNSSIIVRSVFGTGNNYTFTIFVGYDGYGDVVHSAAGTDEFAYPSPPVVTGYSGCPTEGCPTSGYLDGNPLKINVTGTGFGLANTSTPVVSVGINECYRLEYVYVSPSSTTLQCELPPGVGIRNPIVVALDGVVSDATVFLKYAAPVVDLIVGCDDGLTFESQPGSAASRCPREGGSHLSVYGEHFGESGARIFLGDQPCENVVHDTQKPHNQLSCTLPQGQSSVAVIVGQKRGVFAAQEVTLSYEPCEPGTFLVNRQCQNCTAGRYSPVEDMLGCLDCQVGAYADTEGLSSCLRCDLGRFNNVSARTECSLCAPGTHSGIKGVRDCLECGSGRFANVSGLSSCHQCPVGKAIDLSGRTTCDDCNLDFFTSSPGSFSCQQCLAQTEARSTGQSACQDCPAGRSRDFDVSGVAQVHCQPCALGRAGTVGCTACVLGRFSNVTGLTDCMSCAKGTYAGGSEQAACQQCQAGRVAETQELSLCTQCAAGRYASEGRDECLPCPVGSEGFDSITCTPCAAGKYQSFEGREKCLRCPLGSFGNDTGQTACLECPRGTYNVLSGTTFCVDCQPGSSSASEGAQSCSQCIAGRYSNVSGAVDCELCPPGHYQSFPGWSRCLACQAGDFAGIPGLSGCAPCEGQFVSYDNAATACTECPAHYESDTAHTNCSVCPFGKQRPLGGTQCVSCQDGNFQAQQGEACQKCPLKTFRNGAVLSCQNCTAGRYGSYLGAVSCRTCPAGRHTPVSPASICENCDLGKYGVVESGLGKCLDCPIGRANDRLGQSVCSICVTGTFTNSSGLEQCVSCSKGKFQDQEKQSACSNCTIGRFVDQEGQALCSPCDAGFYGPTEGLQTCLPCAEGKFQDTPGNDTCKPCEVGKFAGAPRQVTCEPCPTGRYVNDTGADECLPCPVGRAQSQQGQTECLPCVNGTVADSSGLVTCVLCDAGRYFWINGSHPDRIGVCLDCPAGKFQRSKGQTQCTECESGKFNGDTGRLTCTKCLEGTFQPLLGQLNCTKCPKGSEQPSRGGTDCKPCGKGKYSPLAQPVRQTCLDCAAGKYINDTGADECLDCPAGRAQPSVAGTECISASPGKFAASNTKVPVKCPEASVAPVANLEACIPCGSDAIANPSKTQCICKEGTYAVRSGANLTCPVCPAGALCEEVGVEENTLQAREGHWRSSDTTLQFYRCQSRLHCQGGLGSSNALCADNRVGPVCGLCADGYNEIPGGGCVKCPSDDADAILLAIGISLIVFTALVLLFYCVLRSSSSVFQRIEQREFLVAVQTQRRLLALQTGAVPDASPTTTPSPPEGRASNYVVDETKAEPPAPPPETPSVEPQTTPTRLFNPINEDVHVQVTVGDHNNGTPSLGSMGGTTPSAGDRSGRRSRYSPGTPRQFTASHRRHISRASGNFDAVAAEMRAERELNRPVNRSRRGGLLVGAHLGSQAAAVSSRATPENAPASPEGAGSNGMSETERADLNHLTESADDRLNRWKRRRRVLDMDIDEGVKEPERVIAEIHKATSHQFKIVVSFFQVATQIVFSLDFPWPEAFSEFFSVFNFLTLDVIKMSSINCVTQVDYLVSYSAFLLFPVVAATFLFMVMVVPAYVGNWFWRSGLSAIMKRVHIKHSWLKFRKVMIIVLFLIFPKISASVLQVFMCREIEGEWYLKNDVSVQCFESRWNKYAILSGFMVAVYPVGIPLYFLLKLYYNTATLDFDITKYELGFLYEPYSRSLWFFELCDMLHKLLLTSMIGFLPVSWYYPTAMAIIISYTMVILIGQPYFKFSDLRLHLTAQIELFLLVLGGLIFSKDQNWLDTEADLVLSIILIGIILVFLSVFLFQVFNKVVNFTKSIVSHMEPCCYKITYNRGLGCGCCGCWKRTWRRVVFWAMPKLAGLNDRYGKSVDALEREAEFKSATAGMTKNDITLDLSDGISDTPDSYAGDGYDEYQDGDEMVRPRGLTDNVDGVEGGDGNVPGTAADDERFTYEPSVVSFANDSEEYSSDGVVVGENDVPLQVM